MCVGHPNFALAIWHVPTHTLARPILRLTPAPRSFAPQSIAGAVVRKLGRRRRGGGGFDTQVRNLREAARGITMVSAREKEAAATE